MDERIGHLTAPNATKPTPGSGGQLVFEWTVTPEETGRKLVRVLSERQPNLRFGQIQKLLRQKDIRIDNNRVHTDQPLSEGSVVRVFLPAMPDQPLYRLLDCDPHLAIVSKQPGVIVEHDAPEDPALIDRVRQDLDAPQAELCHRLDRQTGGLLAVALSPDAADVLGRLIRSQLIRRRYRCLVFGRPDQGSPVITADRISMLEIRNWLQKDAGRSQVFVHDRCQTGDKAIITRYRVLRRWPALAADDTDVSELEVELVTGRTHQIRAHFAHLGYPLVGDGKYGRNAQNQLLRGRNGPLRHQQLWACELAFPENCPEPLTGWSGRVLRQEPEYDLDLPEPSAPERRRKQRRKGLSP